MSFDFNEILAQILDLMLINLFKAIGFGQG